MLYLGHYVTTTLMVYAIETRRFWLTLSTLIGLNIFGYSALAPFPRKQHKRHHEERHQTDVYSHFSAHVHLRLNTSAKKEFQ